MRRRLWPLGLAALFFNPVSSYAADGGTGRAAEANPPISARAVEAAGPLTLDAALELALRASPRLAVAAREREALDAALVQARARPNPDISVFIEDTRSATRVTTLQLNQPIELGGKRDARIDAAERGRDAAAAEYEAQRAELRATVKAAFFDVLIAQERLRLAEESIELARRASNAAARRVAAGVISPVEETKARVAETGVRLEAALAANELTAARLRLAATWGNPLPRFERAEGEPEVLPPLPDPAALTPRLAASPALSRAGIEVERRRALTEVERSRRLGDLTVSLGARRNEELGLDQALLGVSLPLPIFNRNQGNLLEALRRTDQARDELAAAEVRLSNELALAYGQLKTAREETESLRRDVLPGARSAFEAASRGFDLGKFSFLDVLDAQRTLFQARSHYLRALAGAHRAAADIERLLGGAVPGVTPHPTPAPAAAQP